jgi:hypothetical protein
MERALKLVATGTLTIAMTQVPRGEPIIIPRTFNRTNGKKSTRPTSFSDIAWHKASRAYSKSARALSKDKFDAIVEDALAFVKPTRAPNRTADNKETTNERAYPADDPNSGEECMSSFCHPSRPTPFFNLTYVFFQNQHGTVASIYLNLHHFITRFVPLAILDSAPAYLIHLDYE